MMTGAARFLASLVSSLLCVPSAFAQSFPTPRILTSGAAFDDWPCFSPDGRTVVFTRSASLGKTWTDWHLVAMPAVGGAERDLVLPIVATRPNWSTLGVIAFTGTTVPDRKSGIWIVNGDGSGAHAAPTSDTPHDLIYPSWYPDGKSVAVMDDTATMLRRLDLGTGTTVALTDPAHVYSGMGSVSPDGKAIAFAGQTNDGKPYDQLKNIIWLMDGGAPSPLNAGQGRAPSWSPDGKRIVFESNRGGGNNYAIFLINRDGSGLEQITDYTLNAAHPVFSRDGRYLVISYGTAQKHGIAVIDLP
jgi:Tol biopolymer transport system component